MSKPTPLEEVRKSLRCLYIDASKEAADDVNAKVEFYIQQVESKISTCEADKTRLRDALDEIVNVRDIPREPFEDVSVFEESTYRCKIAKSALAHSKEKEHYTGCPAIKGNPVCTCGTGRCA